MNKRLWKFYLFLMGFILIMLYSSKVNGASVGLSSSKTTLNVGDEFSIKNSSPT